MSSKVRNRKLVLLYVLTFCLFSFYSYAGLGNAARKIPLFMGELFLLVYTFGYLVGGSNDRFYKLFKYIIFINLISFLMPFVFRGQGLILSYRVGAWSLTLLMFFFFLKEKIELKDIETYIWVLAVIYIILWTYAFTHLPAMTFGISDEEGATDDSRGIVRINFVGRNSLVFAYFMALVKWSYSKKKLYGIAAIVFFVFIVLQLTRQIILWSLLVTIIYMLVRNKAKLFAVVGVCLIAVMFFLPTIKISDDSILGSMLDLTERQMESQQSGEDDVRVLEYEHYFTKWHDNIAEVILGSGPPHSESGYGKMDERMQDMYGFYLSDVGYARMFAITGIVGLALYLMLFFAGATAKMPPQLEYVNLFMCYMIPANIAAAWYSGSDVQIALSICGYLIYQYGQYAKRKSPRCLLQET